MRFATPSSTKALISLTPLVDVVFILLVFFMLVSSFTSWQQVELALSGQGAGSANRRPSITLSVLGGGRYLINDLEMNAARLRDRLRRDPRLEEGAMVFVAPTSSASVQDITSAMELLGALGIGQAALIEGPRE